MFYRRPSEGIPAGITAHAQPVIPEALDKPGLVLWLSADDPNLSLSGSDVITIPDRSGLGHDATAAVGQRGTLVTSGFGSNSKPYILIDGVDDNYAVADTTDLEFGTGTFAIFTALRFVSGSGGFQAYVGKGSDTAGTAWRCFRVSTNNLAQYSSGGTAYASSTLTVADGVDVAIMSGIDALNAKLLYGKGATRERTTVVVVNSPGDANSMRLGHDNTAGTYFANIRFAELAIFKRSAATAFTDAEVESVLSYYQTKYGI